MKDTNTSSQHTTLLTTKKRRELYKYYYESSPIVAQAIDLHAKLSLSLVEIGS